MLDLKLKLFMLYEVMHHLRRFGSEYFVCILKVMFLLCFYGVVDCFSVLTSIVPFESQDIYRFRVISFMMNLLSVAFL